MSPSNSNLVKCAIGCAISPSPLQASHCAVWLGHIPPVLAEAGAVLPQALPSSAQPSHARNSTERTRSTASVDPAVPLSLRAGPTLSTDRQCRASSSVQLGGAYGQGIAEWKLETLVWYLRTGVLPGLAKCRTLRRFAWAGSFSRLPALAPTLRAFSFSPSSTYLTKVWYVSALVLRPSRSHETPANEQ